ncbi:hypothetical protein OS189_16820 [Sulfitobacter sp. F26169L]|uniref:class I SAM-dependent methyltransferase n=1 Tax=Sulfitobacter sp. F26169L TaxID=2996015 RepID=UPI002260EFF1|nr:class I SAM-dependent methyltransferase [Sulfitobacter sp. F26169L]MCX7568008.1 hypothetical protein [Sulfitobacter sp. F26169L]
MTHEIERNNSQEITKVNLQMTNPLSSRGLFWRARYRVESNFHAHLPFLFWLVEIQRPTSIMEIGITDGQSYFGLCQAVDRLNLPAQCTGIIVPESPKSDEKTKQDQIANIKHYNDENYAEFSKLSRAKAVGALTRCADNSIDLLVLDATLDSQELEQVLNICKHKMSDRAVLLLKGFPNKFVENQHYMIAQSFIDTHETILLENGTGIAAILIGGNPDNRLSHFASLKAGSADYNNIHTVFSSLGKARSDEWKSAIYEEKSKNSFRKLKAAQEEHMQTKAELEALTQAYNARSDAIATAQAESYDLRVKITEVLSLQQRAVRTQKKLKTKYAKKKVILETAQIDLKAMTQKEADWREKYQALKVVSDKVAKDNETLISKIKSIEDEQAAQDKVVQIQKEMLAERDVKIGERLATIDALEARQVKSLARVAALEAEHETLVKRHQDEVVLLTQEMEVREAEQAESLVRVAALEAEHDTLVKQHHHEITSLKQQAKVREAEYEVLAKAHNDELSALNSKLSDRDVQITSQLDELDQYDARTKEYEQRIRKIEQEISHANALCASYEKSLQNKSKEAAYKDCAYFVKIRLREIQMQQLEKSRGRLSAFKSRSVPARTKQVIETVRQHPLFDQEWYLEQYPDVRRAGVDAALHFATVGIYEGRNPSPAFNTIEHYIARPERLEEEFMSLPEVPESTI